MREENRTFTNESDVYALGMVCANAYTYRDPPHCVQLDYLGRLQDLIVSIRKSDAKATKAKKKAKSKSKVKSKSKSKAKAKSKSKGKAKTKEKAKVTTKAKGKAKAKDDDYYDHDDDGDDDDDDDDDGGEDNDDMDEEEDQDDINEDDSDNDKPHRGARSIGNLPIASLYVLCSALCDDHFPLHFKVYTDGPATGKLSSYLFNSFLTN